MTHNDILKNLRYTFDFNDDTMMKIFFLTGLAIERVQVCSWLKKEDEPDYQAVSDENLASFLNGLIILKRGAKDGPLPTAETSLNNNVIFKKIKIALNLKDDDIIEIMDLADFRISKYELSAFFRRTNHKNYRACKNQILRNFLKGLQLKYRP